MYVITGTGKTIVEVINIMQKIHKSSILHSIFFIALTLLCLYAFTGCANLQANQAPENNPADDSKKVPGTLKEFEENMGEIIEELDKEDDEEDESEMTLEIKTEIKQEETPEESTNETTQEQKQEIKKETTEDKMWETVEEKLETMHKQWNELQPKIVQAGISKEKVDAFSTALNDVTMAADETDKMNTLLGVSNLYAFVADFMAPYESDIPPDVKRMQHFLRNAKYHAMLENWEAAKENMENAKAHWQIVKAQTEKEQEEHANKMEFSIYQMEKVIDESNATLSELKGDLALQNLEALEESFE